MGHAAHAGRINSPSEFVLIRLQVGIKGLGQAMTDHVVKRKFGWPVDGAAVASDWRSPLATCSFFRRVGYGTTSSTLHELVTVAEGRLEVMVAGSRFVV